MSDDTIPGNVFPFPQIGFNLAPTTPPATPADDDDADGVPPYTTRPDWDAVTVNNPGRRSPLDIINNLPNPALRLPVIPTPPAGPVPGYLPDTFHSPAGNGPDMTGPRLGALSLAACLAVAVAALRGTHTYLTDRRQARLTAAEEAAPIRQARLKHQLVMQQLRYDAAQTSAKQAKQRAKNNRVPSSTEFGRKSLGNRSTGTGGGSRSGRGGKGPSSGTGAGAKRSAGKGSSSGSLFSGGGSAKKNNPKNSPNSNRSLFGGGNGSKGPGGSGGHGHGGGKGPKAPHRGSQGAGGGHSLKKHDTKHHGSGASGSGRTGLGAALKKDTHNAAARRLERRRKNGLDKPALWGAPNNQNNAKNQPNTPKKNGKGKGGHGGGAVPVAANNTPNPKKPKNAKTPNKAQAAGTNRKNLGQALWHDWKKAAGRRFNKRQHQRKAGHVPPIWKAPRPPKQQRAAAAGANTPKANRKNPKQAANQQHKRRRNRNWAMWAKAARAYARKKAAGARFPGGARGPQHGGAQGAQQAAGTPGAAGAQQQAGPRQRKSPFANAAQAAAGPTTWTVTSEHVPGSQAKCREPNPVTPGTPTIPATGPAALDQAPTPHTARPGTTRPKEPIPMPPTPARRPDPRITKAKHQAHRAAVQTVGRQMDAQHETEITLDDACDAADQLTSDAFKTHDQCHRLADKARKLRDTWVLFADDLATNHNLIGPLFTGAALRFAESMDLVARMADEMEVSSLEASEKAETSGNEINDAYRPYNTATADAGLSTPSAPIHNQT